MMAAPASLSRNARQFWWFSLLCAFFGTLTPWLSRLLPLSGGDAWLLDLPTHFQVFWLIFLVLIAGLFWVHRERRPAGVALLGILSAVVAVPPTLPSWAGPAPGASLTVVTANLLYGKADLSTLRRWLAEQQADIVVLQEVTPAAGAVLATWTEYQGRRVAASMDAFGMAVLARDARVTTQWNLAQGVPYASTTGTFQGRPFHLFGVHPLPPLSPGYNAERVELLAEVFRKAGPDTLLAGDFNASPWSAVFPHGQLAWTGYQPPALLRVHAYQPSWLGVLAIDHVLATPEWLTVGAGQGPDIGSDHRPMWARLARQPGA